MPITIRRPGWPLLTIDTPEERERLKAAHERAKAKLPLLFEIEMNEKQYRLRGYVNDGMVSGSVVEWMYRGEWREVRSYEICTEIKELYEKQLNT